MGHVNADHIITEALQHEARLKTSSGDPDKYLRAWQRACAFLQAQLPLLKAAQEPSKKSCRRLLVQCQSCAVQLKGNSNVLQHQATLQYHFLRLSHEQKEYKLVIKDGLSLSSLLQKQEPQPWVLHLQQSCLTAVVSATYHQALCPSEFSHCASAIAALGSVEAAQLARNLIVAHVSYPGLQQLEDHISMAAFSTLADYAAVLPDAGRVFTRLMHFSSDSAMHDLLQAMTDSCPEFTRIALAECGRRQTMFTTFPDSCELLQILTVSQAASATLMRGCPNWMQKVSRTLQNVQHSNQPDVAMIALEVSLNRAATMLDSKAGPAADDWEPEQSALGRWQILLDAVAALCDLCMRHPQGSVTQQISSAVTATSAVTLQCCQSRMSAAAKAAVLHRSQVVTDSCLDAAIAFMPMRTVVDDSPCVLLTALRRMGSGMYNCALDMRDSGNGTAALVLLRIAIAVCLTLAGFAELGGQPEGQTAVTRDALKRCSLGFQLIHEKNLLEQGALVSLLLMICGRVATASQELQCAVWTASAKALKYAVSHMAELQKLVHVTAPPLPTPDAQASAAAMVYSDSHASDVSESDSEDAHQILAQQLLEAQQAMCRTTSSVHSLMSALKKASGGASCAAGFLRSAIPLVLDMQAIAALAGNTCAAACAACALQLCTQMCGQGGDTAAGCTCTVTEPASLAPLRTLASWSQPAPLPMCGQPVSASSMATQLEVVAGRPAAVLAPLTFGSVPGRSPVAIICNRIMTGVRTHGEAAQHAADDTPVEEVALGAAQLQVLADSLSCCVDELCAVQRSEWESQAARQAVAELHQALWATGTRSPQEPQRAALACCQRVAVLACSMAESSCRALERCMRLDDSGSGHAMSVAGPGRWYLSHQLARGALQAVRLLRAQGLGRQAIHLRKVSTCFLSALGLHMPAQLLQDACQGDPHNDVLRIAVSLAAENHCPALAAGLSVQAAAAALLGSHGAGPAAALAALEDAGFSDTAARARGRKPAPAQCSILVSVDTLSSWEALEDPADQDVSSGVDDVAQLSHLSLTHWRQMHGAHAYESNAVELRRWSGALTDAQLAMVRRARLQALTAARASLDPGSIFEHYAAKSLLSSSGLGMPALGTTRSTRRATQKRPARGRRGAQAAVKGCPHAHALRSWIQDAVQLCGAWGNANVFSFLHSLAYVCAQQYLSNLQRAQAEAELGMLCAPSETLMKRSCSDEAAQAALMLFAGAFAVSPVSPAACAPACEELALFAAACGMAATPFMALQAANRLATANAVQMWLLSGDVADAGKGGGPAAESTEVDFALHALHACCQPADDGGPSYEAGMVRAVQLHCPRQADAICMAHARDRLDQPACLLVASYSCTAASATDGSEWTVRAAMLRFGEEDSSTASIPRDGRHCCGSGSDAEESNAAGCPPVASLQAGLQTVHSILEESASGCKRWTAAAAPGKAGAEPQTQDGTAAAGCATTRSADARGADGRHEWWSWRTALDERLHVVVKRVGDLCKGALNHCLPQHKPGAERARRSEQAAGPVEISLAWDLQRFPWEAIEPLATRPVFRTLPGLCAHRQAVATDESMPCKVDVQQAMYVVDPAGDLPGTRKRFEPWFRSISSWHGTCGAPAMEQQELHERMRGHKFFIFLGHGAGLRGGTDRLPLPSPAALLMGCSSASLGVASDSATAAAGPTAAYIAAGSPCVIANLWDVTDRDIDLFTEDLLKRSITSGAHSTSCKADSDAQSSRPMQGLKHAAAALSQLDLNAGDESDGDWRPETAPRAAGTGCQTATKRKPGRRGRLQQLAAQAAAIDATSADPEGREKDPGSLPGSSQTVKGPRRLAATTLDHAPGTTGLVPSPKAVRTQRGQLRDTVQWPNGVQHMTACDVEGPCADRVEHAPGCSTGDVLLAYTAAKPSLKKGDKHTSSAEESIDLVASSVNASRSVCRLRWLNGAAPVCYGVPTILSNDKPSE
eukprot:jgi/Ulvmu1/4074/UM019_0052.1